MSVENVVLLIIAIVMTLLAVGLAFVIATEIVRIAREFQAQIVESRRKASEQEPAPALDDSRSRATRMKAALQRGATSLEGERERSELTGE